MDRLGSQDWNLYTAGGKDVSVRYTVCLRNEDMSDPYVVLADNAVMHGGNLSFVNYDGHVVAGWADGTWACFIERSKVQEEAKK